MFIKGSMDIQYRALMPADSFQYRQIRLESLKLHPECFGSGYQEQVNHPTSELPLFTMEVGKVPKFFNRSLYRIKALVYPKTIKPKFDMMREICELPLDTYTDGSRFNVWPHNLPQICAVSPSLCPQPADWPDHRLRHTRRPTVSWFARANSGYRQVPGDGGLCEADS